MKIAVLGTGMVGREVAARLAGLDHEVTLGTRDPAATLARSEADAMGNPPFAEWHSDRAAIGLAPFREAVAGSDLVVNALNGGATLEVLNQIGAEALGDRILLDIANPLDGSTSPPTLTVKDTDSLGEQIQRAFPGVRVVKTLNTMNAYLMVDPGQLAGGDFTTFVSGDDAESKARVTELLGSIGHRDIIDLGDITTARGAEMLLPIWLRLWNALGTPMFNFKVVR